MAYILLLAAVASFCSMAFVHHIGADEREHLYATYLVAHGYVPYRDFFEHHHPLLWYLAAPLLYVWDNTPWIWHILRGFGVVVAALTAFVIYKTARLADVGKTAAIMAVACWFDIAIVRWAGNEFRPDNLMVLFYVIGLFYFLRYFKYRQFIDLQLAFLWFLFSLAALQKILTQLVGLGAVVLWGLASGRIRLRDMVLALIAPLLLLAGVLAIFWQAGMLRDYFELNWLLNSLMSPENPYEMIAAYHFSVPILGTLLSLWLFRSENMVIRLAAFLNLVSNILMFAVLPICGKIFLWSQYFLIIYPYFAILAAYALEPLLHRPKTALALTAASILFVSWQAVSTALTYFSVPYGVYQQKGVAAIILNNSTPKDKVLGSIEMNTVGGLRFNPTGYYWFSFGSLVPLHRHFFPNSAREFPQLNAIIQARRPKIVINSSWDDCHYNSEKRAFDCGHQEIDAAKMKESYTNNGFIYMRGW